MSEPNKDVLPIPGGDDGFELVETGDEVESEDYEAEGEPSAAEPDRPL